MAKDLVNQFNECYQTGEPLAFYEWKNFMSWIRENLDEEGAYNAYSVPEFESCHKLAQEGKLIELEVPAGYWRLAGSLCADRKLFPSRCAIYEPRRVQP